MHPVMASSQGKIDLKNNNVSANGPVYIGNFLIGPNDFLSSIIPHTSASTVHPFNLSQLYPERDPETQRDYILTTWSDGMVCEGTCTWIENDSKYKEWIESENTNHLWILGGNGKGKTFLSVHITQHLEQVVVEKGVGMVIYYFFDGENHLKSTAEGALKSMIWTLCRKDQSIMAIVAKELEDRAGGADLQNFELIWLLFKKAVSSPSAGTVYCVLDGLDRCEQKSLEKLLINLSTLSHSGFAQASLKIVLVSTPCPSIKNGLENSAFVRLCLDCQHPISLYRCVGRPRDRRLTTSVLCRPRSPEKPSLQSKLQSVAMSKSVTEPQGLLTPITWGQCYSDFIARDVTRFIDSRLGSLRTRYGWSESLYNHVRTCLIVTGPGDSFLWVSLMIKEVEVLKADDTKIRKLLKSLPATIEKDYATSYQQLQQNSGDDEEYETFKLLSTVFFAQRPLKLYELGAFVWPEVGNKDTTSILNALQQKTKSLIDRNCRSFLVIDNRNFVTLYHHSTARLFLEQKFRESGMSTNIRMSETCFDTIWDWTSQLEKSISVDQTYAFKERINTDIDDFPLLEYAILHWTSHLWKAGRPSNRSSMWEPRKRGFFSSPKNFSRDIWFRCFWQLTMGHWQYPRCFCPVHFAGFFGLRWYLLDILRSHSNPGATLSAECSFGMTALHWACRNGHQDIVEIILQYSNIDVNSRGYGIPPLYFAIQNQRLDIAQALLKRGAKTEIRVFGSTALHWAIYQGNIDMVKLLLRYKSNTEARVTVNETAIWAILRTSFRVFPWARLSPFQGPENEIRAQYVENRERLARQYREKNAAITTLLIAYVSSLPELLGPWILAFAVGIKVPVLLQALGYKMQEAYILVLAFAALWGVVGAVYRAGFLKIAAIFAIALCSVGAGLISGITVMSVAGAVCCSATEGEIIMDSTNLVLNLIRPWLRTMVLGVCALTLGHIQHFGVVIWALHLTVWAILLCFWASVPSLLVFIAGESDGNWNWGVLAIPCIALSLWAYVTLTAQLVALRSGSSVKTRIWVYSLALLATCTSSMLIIVFRPLQVFPNSIGHFTVTLLDGVWSFFGVVVSIIIAESSIYIPALLSSYMARRGRGYTGQTALLLAVASGNEKSVRLLLDAGANADARDGKGRTCQILAQKLELDDILKMLQRYQRSSVTR